MGGGQHLPYDAEVEYLESTGTQYLNPSISYWADFEIVCNLRTNSSNVTLFCGNNNRLERDSAANPYWKFRSSSGMYTSTVLITEKHTLTWRKGIISVDGIAVKNLNKPYQTGSLYISGFPSTQYPCIFYRIKFYDSADTLVRDFIPVRVGQVGYLYDRVSGQLFGNAGTGAFVVGPDVNN